MNEEAKTRLKGMFSCFPQGTEVDPRAYLGGLILACEGVSDAAIIKAVEDIVTGNAESINPNFGPSTAAFGVYARKIDRDMELVRRAKERPALTAPTYEPSDKIKQEGTAEERRARVAKILGRAIS